MELLLTSLSSLLTPVTSISILNVGPTNVIFFLLLPYLGAGSHIGAQGWLLSFLDLVISGRTPWTGDQLVARPLPKHRTTQTQKNADTHLTSMPKAGFEPAITASERSKTVRTSDKTVRLPRPAYKWYTDIYFRKRRFVRKNRKLSVKRGKATFAL
jgi:hypothetical protein